MKLGSALFWTLLSVGVASVLKLAGNLTLARLLTADAFGLAAMVFAITSGIEAITDVGAQPALIRSNRTDAAWLNTSWTLGLVRGLGIAVVIALLAYPTALFFNDQRLVPLIVVSSLMSILIGIKSNQAILAVRNLQAKNFALVELAAAVVGYVIMLLWAWYAPSAWALLAGALVTSGMVALLSFRAFGHRQHHFCWDRSALNELVSFGKWVFFASILGFFILQGDRIVIGKFRGLYEAGIYSIAITWSGALHQLFFMFLSRLYLPVVAQFKRLGGGTEAVTRLRYLILSAMVIPYALLAGTAEQLISFMYPNTFTAAGPVMGILVAGAWFSALEFVYNDQLMLAGKPAWRAYAQILSILAIGGGLIAFAADTSLPLIAALFAGGIVVRGLMLMVVNSRHNLRLVLPDLAITVAFILIAWAIKSASGMLAEQYSPFIALLICFGCLSPFGATMGWVAIKRALDLAANVSADSQQAIDAPPAVAAVPAI
jgi:O-antigen/teichoic acid export membrane protein